MGRYPDLAGLAEIVKPAKTLMDKTPVPTAPSQINSAQGSSHCS